LQTITSIVRFKDMLSRGIRFARPLAFGAAGVALASGCTFFAHRHQFFSQAAGAGLDEKDFRDFELVNVRKYNHNSKVYTISVPGQSGLPVASFILAKSPNKGADGKDVVRPYTPIDSKVAGQIELLIKTYPTGPMSSYLDSLSKGAKVSLKGPVPKIAYQPNMKKEIGMLAGGTGITPMLQVLRKICDDPKDQTKVSVVFCNLTEEDILLKDMLDGLVAKNKNISITYSVDNPKPSWSGAKGLITPDLIKAKMPKPSDDSLIMVCGPPGFMTAVSGQKAPDYSQGELAGFLKGLGYSPKQVFKF